MARWKYALTPLIRRRRRRKSGEDQLLRLASVGIRIRPNEFLDRPIVAALVGEDAAWQCSVASWLERRPRWWHFRGRRAWSGEGNQLESKRQRLYREAFQLGLCARVSRAGFSA